MMNWLPEFALTSSECAGINSGNAVEMLRKAARLVYQSDKFSKRGEFGELFLHAAIRQVHDSLPAISKLFYKSAVNDTVKGFDAVHVVGPPDAMELWLGEAKFYDDDVRAVRDVVAEIEQHMVTDYLRNEFLLIGNKLDDNWPHTQQLKRLLAQETSLDDVFKRACIPVLLTYNSKCLSSFNECCVKYENAFKLELTSIHNRFSSAIQTKSLPKEVRVHLFLMPLKDKAELVKLLDGDLKRCQ